MFTTNQIKSIVGSGLLGFSILLAQCVHASILLDTDFTGRIVSGSTANNITWTSLGINAPGSLTAKNNPDGLFDTVNAQGFFAPNRNIVNEGSWDVDIPLVLSGNSITLGNIVIDYQDFNNDGEFQLFNRDTDWIVTLTGSSTGLIYTESQLNQTESSGIITFTPSSLFLLTNTETYNLNIFAVGQDLGNNTGINALTINGDVVATVPVPAAVWLFGSGLVGLIGMRKKSSKVATLSD